MIPLAIAQEIIRDAVKFAKLPPAKILFYCVVAKSVLDAAGNALAFVITALTGAPTQ